MRALIIFCHPDPKSYNAAIKDVVIAELEGLDCEYRLHDLYAENFDPLLTAEDLITHVDYPDNIARIPREADDLTWCDTLIFIYPTWNHAMPAMLKGWMDRVLVAGLAFHMPKPGRANPTSGLTHIKGLLVFTTGGSGPFFSWFFGNAGRKMLMRSLRAGLNLRAKSKFVVKYKMNTSTPQQLEDHKTYVAKVIRDHIKKRQ